jgi:hypothetical protein
MSLYSVVVTNVADAWGGAPFGLSLDRFGEFTAPAILERFKALDSEALAALQELPVLLAYEQSHGKPALVARITRFHHSSRGELRFSYEVRADMPPISPDMLAELQDQLDLGRWEMHRTHWAVKDVDLWAVLRGAGIIIPPTDPTYDVALSFAGEDRSYVEQVAMGLRDAGVRVFYDMFEEANLWGADLYAHLTEVYSKRARYTVLFASQHYAKKQWTSLERRAAQERAFREQSLSILPARFDDTEIPGILTTTGYVDLRHRTAEDLVALILVKLGRTTPPARAAGSASAAVKARSHQQTYRLGPDTQETGSATPGFNGVPLVDEAASRTQNVGSAPEATIGPFVKFAAHDAAIGRWFARQGWPVTRRSHDFNRDVFMWHHEPAERSKTGERRTLGATLTTLEDLGPERLVSLLEGAEIAKRLKTQPQVPLVVYRMDDGEFGVAELD